MKRASAIAILLASCAPEAASVNSKLVAQRQEAARITSVCRLPADTLVVRDDGSMRLRPKPTETYQKVDCALSELRKSGLLSNLPMGFVGNERYDENLQ